MKYLKLFENNNDKAFWDKVLKMTNVSDADDDIDNYFKQQREADDFEDFLEQLANTSDIASGLQYVVVFSYINRIKEKLRELPGGLFNDEKVLKALFEGKPNSRIWSSDGEDPVINQDIIFEAVANDYVYKFIYSNIKEWILFDKLIEFILEEPSRYNDLVESDLKIWAHNEIKDMVIKELKKEPRLKEIIRQAKSGLWNLEK